MCVPCGAAKVMKRQDSDLWGAMLQSLSASTNTDSQWSGDRMREMEKSMTLSPMNEVKKRVVWTGLRGDVKAGAEAERIKFGTAMGILGSQDDKPYQLPGFRSTATRLSI